MGDALELRDGLCAAVRRLGAVAAEGERLHFGEEDGVFGPLGGCGCEGEGEEEGGRGYVHFEL